MKSILSLKGITKKYKSFTLGAIDCEIPCGFSTALIGANGAGKTTLLNILSGILAQTDGSMRFFDKYDSVDSSDVRNAVGYCSANNFFPLGWSAKNISRSMSVAFDNFSAERFAELCKEFGLATEKEKPKPLSMLSDGNKMRLSLAAILARSTDLLMLDEPASSLDPLMRDTLCDKFRQYIAEGDGERSILFSTHNIADMEYATDYAIYMHNGKIIEQGFVEELKEKYRIVHGSGSLLKELEPFMLSVQGNATSFEGIALSEKQIYLSSYDVAVESPTLQQLSVGILRAAEASK